MPREPSGLGPKSQALVETVVFVQKNSSEPNRHANGLVNSSRGKMLGVGYCNPTPVCILSGRKFMPFFDTPIGA